MMFFLTFDDVAVLFNRIDMYGINLCLIKKELPNVITRKFYCKFDTLEINVTGISRNDTCPNLEKAITSIYSALSHKSVSYFMRRPNIFDIVHAAIDNIVSKHSLEPIRRK